MLVRKRRMQMQKILSAQVSGKKWGPVQFQDKKRTETKSQQRILPDIYIYIYIRTVHLYEVSTASFITNEAKLHLFYFLVSDCTSKNKHVIAGTIWEAPYKNIKDTMRLYLVSQRKKYIMKPTDDNCAQSCGCLLF